MKKNINLVYQIIPASGYFVIKLTGDCSMDIKNFHEEVKNLITSPCPHVIVNCEHLSALSNDWIRELLGLQVSLGKFNKEMRFIMVSQAVKNIFKQEGLDGAFKSLFDLREALSELGLVSKKLLDTDFINPFLNATLHVLEVQATVKAVAGKVFLKETSDHFVGDISGVIGIVSETFNGSVVISFPKATFLKVMSSMLGEDYKEMNQDLLDGAGEITNMIFGQAKISLNERGYGIKTALPSVVSGKNHSMSAVSDGPTVVVPFESTAGNFFVEIFLSA